MSIQHRQNEIRRYLLGDPAQDEEQRSAIEREYLKKTAAYNDLLEMEDELVDAYVFGRLRDDETALFRDSLENSSRWRKKVELATALREYAAQPFAHEPRRAFFGIPLNYRFAAACGVGVLAVGAALAVYSLRTNRINRPAPNIAKTEHPPNLQTPPNQVPAPQVESHERTRPKAPTAAVLSFVLIPDLVRGNGEQTQVTLSPGRHVVQLRMERDDEPYGRYEATVSTPEGRTIAYQTDLRPRASGRNRTVILALSSGILKPGVYILNLKGQTTRGERDDLDDYTFQVSSQ